jgi:prepilin-type N-terminal cleavage/methylation domain-containing protein
MDGMSRAQIPASRAFPAPVRACLGAGFSLIELLVVISIIAILASLLLSSIKLVRMQASKLVCQSQLRSIGLAISAYTNDWQGILPGPTGYGQMHSYRNGDVNLPMYLWDGLEGEEPNDTYQVLKPFACKEATQRSSPLSYMGFNGDPTRGAPGTQKRWSPFGVYAGPNHASNRDPWPLSLVRKINLNTLWALKEVDKMNVNPATGWWPSIPAGPVHGAYRKVLFFDFRTDSILATTDTGVF